jgi:hypothetical protein
MNRSFALIDIVHINQIWTFVCLRSFSCSRGMPHLNPTVTKHLPSQDNALKRVTSSVLRNGFEGAIFCLVGIMPREPSVSWLPWSTIRIPKFSFFCLLSLFWSNESTFLWSPCCVYLSPVNVWLTETIFMKFCMYVIAFEPISSAFFIKPWDQSLCIHLSPVVTKHRLGIHSPIFIR